MKHLSIVFRLALLGMIWSGLSVNVAQAQSGAPRPGNATWMPPAGLPQDPAKALDPIIEQLLHAYHAPGAVLAVAYKGQLVYAKGYGLANIAAQENVEANTPFILASVSKIITAQAVLQLVKDGHLHLEDQVFPRYFPDIKPPSGQKANSQYSQITVRELLEHAGGWDRDTSGEPRSYGPRVQAALHTSPPLTLDQLSSYMIAQPLDFPPGSKQVYSNYGYSLLGALIERVSKEKYADYCQKHVLAPAGLQNTVFNIGNKYLPGQAHRYGYNGEEVSEALPPLSTGPDGWISPAPDMALLLAHIAGELKPALLPSALQEQMLAPPSQPLKVRPNRTWFGLGWDYVVASPWGYNYAKDGNVLGTNTYAQHLAAGFDIVLMFNGGDSKDDSEKELNEGIAQISDVLLKTSFAWPKPTSTPQ